MLFGSSVELQCYVTNLKVLRKPVLYDMDIAAHTKRKNHYANPCKYVANFSGSQVTRQA